MVYTRSRIVLETIMDSNIAILGLVALVLVAIAVIITVMLTDRGYQVQMLRMQDDYIEELAIRDEAHEQALLKILRAGEILGNEFSVDHAKDWAYGTDRVVETFDNMLEFLNCIADCRAQSRTVFYTRIGTLILSN